MVNKMTIGLKHNFENGYYISDQDQNEWFGLAHFTTYSHEP